MEVHTASDLHRKQWPDETLHEYIQNFMDLTEKAKFMPVITEVKTEVNESLNKGHMIQTEESILYLMADPEITIIQKGYTEG